MSHTTDRNAEIKNITTSTVWSYDALSLENQAALFLWKVWPPCLLLLGGFGNIATVFVMRCIKDNNSSQHAFLMALAVSDFSLLYVALMHQWVYYLFDVELGNLHIVICKVTLWLAYATGTTSSWLLTCVTVQRTMAVKWPHKMRMMCSLQRTWIVIAAVVTCGCALHLHFVFGMVISDDNVCTFRSVGYGEFITHVWSWVDLTTLSLFPSVCLLSCGVILSSTLFRAISSTSMTMTFSSSTDSSRINSCRKRIASRTTVMILALSCTFLVLTMPVCIYNIWEKYTYANSTQNDRAINRSSLPVAVTILLWYTNSAVNFLLYCFTGTRFREEFLTRICCDAQVKSSLARSNQRLKPSSGMKDK